MCHASLKSGVQAPSAALCKRSRHTSVPALPCAAVLLPRHSLSMQPTHPGTQTIHLVLERPGPWWPQAPACLHCRATMAWHTQQQTTAVLYCWRPSRSNTLLTLPCTPQTAPLTPARWLLPGDRIRDHQTNVKREIMHQGCLNHPVIANLKEVSSLQDSKGRGSGPYERCQLLPG